MHKDSIKAHVAQGVSRRRGQSGAKPHRKSALDADSRNSSWVPYAFFEYIGKQINAGFD
jgi:hypothetical protein